MLQKKKGGEQNITPEKQKYRFLFMGSFHWAESECFPEMDGSGIQISYS